MPVRLIAGIAATISQSPRADMIYDLVGIVLYGLVCGSFTCAVSGLNSFVSAVSPSTNPYSSHT